METIDGAMLGVILPTGTSVDCGELFKYMYTHHN